MMAGGLQGGVYELRDAAGDVSDTKVLKVAHKFALIIDLEREWSTGQILNQLGGDGKPLPGFMAVGRALRSKDDNAMLAFELEKLHGTTVDKVIKDWSFNDINYIGDMLYEVFLTLDVAQRKLGFHHSDLRVANIMEHHPKNNADHRCGYKHSGWICHS
jgi:hypothetical protein